MTKPSFHSQEHINNEYLTFHRNRLKIVNKILEKYSKPEQKFFEVGCGDGSVAYALSGSMPKSTQIYGVDVSKEGVENATKLGFCCSVCDLENDKLPYEDNFFDIVHCGEIIEHIFNTDHFLREINRVLKPRGILILSTPNLASAVNRILLLFGFQPIDVEVSQHYLVGYPPLVKTRLSIRRPVIHKRAFTPKALKELLGIFNYEVIEFYGTSSVKASLLVKVMDNIVNVLVPAASRTIVIVARKASR